MEDQSSDEAKNRDEDEDEDDDEDSPQLSEHALAALQEFYAERLAKEQQLAASLESGSARVHTHVEEDWQLSQFWYEENTSQVLAEEALQASQSKRIACISCPTLFSKLMELKPPECKAILLEYDRRFEIYGDEFVFYDYNRPLELPEALQTEPFDLVIADPPFLSEECLQKTAQTIKLLAKGKILLCTGAVMEDIAFKVLGVKPCQFVPKHTRNLANEFCCYANYETGLNSVKNRDTLT